MKRINQIFYGLLVLFMLLTITLTFIFRITNSGAIDIFDYQLYKVLSGSMENTKTNLDYPIKNIERNSLIVVKKINQFDELKIGDVITFKYVVADNQETITHRIIDIKTKDDGYLITTKGDNVSSGNVEVIDTNETYTSFNYIIGKVVWKNKFLGNLLTIISNRIGILCFIIIPSMVLLLVEIKKIVISLLTTKKNKQIINQ